MFCPSLLTRSRSRRFVLNFGTGMSQSNAESVSSRLDSLTTEYQICRRKLDSKCEALLILSRELDQCRSERDQFKLMAEQLRDRYQMVKRQLTGDTPMSAPMVEVDPKTYSDIQTQSLARMLFDTKETNKSLKFEVDDLKQKLQDAEGDIKLLREQIARSRVGTTDEGLTIRHFPAHEREDLVKQLEASREEFVQLERDLQQVLDEKEELVTERDAYRTKYERLNTELNYILGGDEKRIVDIDALSMENKFLQERLKQMEEEKTMAMATVTKYRSILEKKKTKGILKLGQSRSGGLVITQKQVQQIMQSRSSITPTPQALADLQGLCGALLDTINDKNLALSHQRKTNKLLGNRVNELEKKLKTLEVSGLWSVSGNLPNLEKLKAECEEIKTLVPRQFSQSTDTSEPPHDASDFDTEPSSVSNSVTTSPTHQGTVLNQLSRLDLEELDLLPTKEEVVKGDNKDATNLMSDASDSVLPHSLSSPGLDSTIGISDVGELSRGSVRMVLTEGALRSLLGNRGHEHVGSGDWKLPHGSHNSGASKWHPGDGDGSDDDVDDDREKAIQKCLRKDTDDEDDDFHCYGIDADDVEDVDEEASEEFKNLLESVTQKLLERSQEMRQEHLQLEQQQDKEIVPEHRPPQQHVQEQLQQQQQQPLENVTPRTVYISDDFDACPSLSLLQGRESDKVVCTAKDLDDPNPPDPVDSVSLDVCRQSSNSENMEMLKPSAASVAQLISQLNSSSLRDNEEQEQEAECDNDNGRGDNDNLNDDDVDDGDDDDDDDDHEATEQPLMGGGDDGKPVVDC